MLYLTYKIIFHIPYTKLIEFIQKYIKTLDIPLLIEENYEYISSKHIFDEKNNKLTMYIKVRTIIPPELLLSRYSSINNLYNILFSKEYLYKKRIKKNLLLCIKKKIRPWRKIIIFKKLIIKTY
jgi:hypothetical protein